MAQRHINVTKNGDKGSRKLRERGSNPGQFRGMHAITP
jgi:hypothetical protein